MRCKKFPLDIAALILLIIAAFVSAAFALRPLVYKAEKTQEIKRENQQFYMNAADIKQSATEAENAAFQQLFLDMEEYNERLFENRQEALCTREATEKPTFCLEQYGLPDEVFGVIRIPKMEVEMPIYLGANEENMANGAAVLSQTSIPIGGENTNSVIAGHRGYSGYDYFKQIELLEVGDEIYIDNLWETMTYKVAEIRIVYPDNVDAVLIQPGREMITLMTCHPYASGGKYRYLVYCERCLDN